ncbi:MAG: helix-turn-helix domain-containing protein, partial [Chloroflexota bacterium]|nr:helix-turn-helix domain-containing protein [Chloroflexota bacterium]
MAVRGSERSFGARLRRLREAAGLTQEELADRAGLSPVAVGKLERGQRRRPYPHTVRALADALGLSEEARAELAEEVPRRAENPAPHARSLPVPPTPLIGRALELAEVVGQVRSGARLVTLTGPGGVGKTRLALEVARAAAEDLAAGTAFVALASLSDARLVVPAIAEALGLREAGEQTLREILDSYLRQQRILLVLDNFEHVLEAAPEVSDLLASCSGLTVLATSRAPLRLRGEREYPVPPLALPNLSRVPDVGDVAGVPAVELFVERARAVAPAFVLTRSNAAAVAAVCRRLDGLPLALELAAARVRTLDPTALLARLDRALPLLSGGARDLPHRQRTMEAAIRWSYDLLGSRERDLFRRLAVFAGGWELTAAEAVGAGDSVSAEDVLELLSRLVERSLVVVEHGESVRYRMLEPVRQFAADLLEQSGQGEEAKRQHTEYYLTLAERLEPELRRASAVEWLDRLEAERGNLRAAVSWVLSCRQAELAARLAYALRRFFWLHGQHGEVLRWMEEALTRGDVLSAGAHARATFVAGLMRYRLGSDEGLVSASGDAAAVLRAEGEVVGAADALILAGVASLRTGDTERAAGLLDESRSLFESVGDDQGSAQALVFLGGIPLSREEYEQAKRYFERGLQLARRSGNPLSIWVALYHMALAAQGTGEYDRAGAYYTEAMTLGEQTKDRTHVALATVGLAECSTAQGDVERAARLYGAADGVFASVGSSFHPLHANAALHERYLKLTREQLTGETFDKAY